MLIWTYDEDTTSLLRPRHPLVCLIDLSAIVMLVSMVHWWGIKHAPVAVYCTALLGMYFASILHHWCAHCDWRHKLDHIMIFVVIAVTALPYWGALFITQWGLIMTAMVIMLGTLIRLAGTPPKLLSATLYAGAAAPMFYDWENFWVNIPLWWNALFMFGVFLYGLQLCIYTFKWCDWWPGLFGHREVQHLVLMLAVFCHALVALVVVG